MKTASGTALDHLSRRDFLKLSGSGILGALFSPLTNRLKIGSAGVELDTTPTVHGRIVNNQVVVYDRPSFSGKVVKMYYQDLVLPITMVTVGDEEPAYNRIWYEMNREGYVHSGLVQPVEIVSNPSQNDISPKGQIVEVTVPFTDAIWNPISMRTSAYRLYYQTVHWATDSMVDREGVTWYKLTDDLWDMSYFVNATHMHIIPPDEVSPLSPNIPVEAKRLEVRLPEQLVIAYEYSKPVFMSRMASGAMLIDGNFSTTAGRFFTNYKRPFRHMATNFHQSSPGYDLPGVPWVCFITKSGISFHGTFWHNDFGHPRSHGCINMPSSAAKWVYRWTLPAVPPEELLWVENSGTIVDISD